MHVDFLRSREKPLLNFLDILHLFFDILLHQVSYDIHFLLGYFYLVKLDGTLEGIEFLLQDWLQLFLVKAILVGAVLQMLFVPS